MTILTKQIINVLTGENQIIELDEVETAERLAEIAENQIKKQAERDNAEALWRTKVSAYEKLGLTEDEIKTIAPTPKWLLPPLPILQPKNTELLGGN